MGLLESVLAAIHLMVVGVAGVGPLVCLWLEGRERRRGHAAAGQAARRLARLSIQALWLGMLLGVVCLALLTLDPATRFWQAFSLIPARRLWFSGAELVFYLVCMEVYVRGWTRLPRLVHGGLALLAGTNVLYHFPLLFSAVSVISRDSELMHAGRTLGWLELVGVFGNPQTISRVVHAILAAGVVTGIALMKIASMRDASTKEASTKEASAKDPSPEDTSPEDTSRSPAEGGGEALRSAADRLGAGGARLALAAALLQVPAGVWILLNLPSSLRDQFLAVDAGTTLLFAGGLLAMIALLHHLAAAALGDASPAILRRCMVLTAALFVCMVGAGHRARAVSAASMASAPGAAGPIGGGANSGLSR